MADFYSRCQDQAMTGARPGGEACGRSAAMTARKPRTPGVLMFELSYSTSGAELRSLPAGTPLARSQVKVPLALPVPLGPDHSGDTRGQMLPAALLEKTA